MRSTTPPLPDPAATEQQFATLVGMFVAGVPGALAFPLMLFALMLIGPSSDTSSDSPLSYLGLLIGCTTPLLLMLMFVVPGPPVRAGVQLIRPLAHLAAEPLRTPLQQGARIGFMMGFGGNIIITPLVFWLFSGAMVDVQTFPPLFLPVLLALDLLYLVAYGAYLRFLYRRTAPVQVQMLVTPPTAPLPNGMENLTAAARRLLTPDLFIRTVALAAALAVVPMILAVVAFGGQIILPIVAAPIVTGAVVYSVLLRRAAQADWQAFPALRAANPLQLGPQATLMRNLYTVGTPMFFAGMIFVGAVLILTGVFYPDDSNLHIHPILGPGPAMGVMALLTFPVAGFIAWRQWQRLVRRYADSAA